MIKAVIIDDELAGLNSLQFMLSEYCKDVSIIGQARGVEEGVSLLEECGDDLDVLFLDIEMPDGTGFDLLSRLGEGKNFAVIFTTAYEQYALEAIKAHALDYLLKPVDHEDLIAAVDNARNKVKEDNLPDTTELIASLTGALNPQDNSKKIAIPTTEGFHLIKMEDVVRLQADGSYTLIRLRGKGNVYSSKNLGELEKMLPEDDFIRIHKKHLVSKKFILKYNKLDGGYVEMENGDQVEISRRKKEFLMDYIKYLSE